MSPRSPETGMSVNSSRPEPLRERAVLPLDLVEALLGVVDEVHLVDGDGDVADARGARRCSVWRRVCVSTPLRASIRMTAQSAVEAPVTMLRVYCSCPGVSATMNLRVSVVK